MVYKEKKKKREMMTVPSYIFQIYSIPAYLCLFNDLTTQNSVLLLYLLFYPIEKFSRNTINSTIYGAVDSAVLFYCINRVLILPFCWYSHIYSLAWRLYNRHTYKKKEQTEKRLYHTIKHVHAVTRILMEKTISILSFSALQNTTANILVIR